LRQELKIADKHLEKSNTELMTENELLKSKIITTSKIKEEAILNKRE